MKKIEVYDPAMCCSSGICGSSVNPALTEIQSVLNSLKELGHEVHRYNLGHQPQNFSNNSKIIEAMGEKAENLPIVLIDGEVCFRGGYPSKQELYSKLEV